MAEEPTPASSHGPTHPEGTWGDWFDADALQGPPHPPPDGGPTPGSTGARERGCICSVLGNAAYRVGAADEPLVDPDCTLH